MRHAIAVLTTVLIILAAVPARASAMRAALREVREKLGEPGASRRAAEAVLTVARSK